MDKRLLASYDGKYDELHLEDTAVISFIKQGDFIDLYRYPTTYTITGGGNALSTSITTNGGGTVNAPKVYEINDNLSYDGNIDLSNYSYIVIRGAVNKRPTILTSTPGGHAFRITGNVVYNYCVIGNLNIELSLDDRYGFYAWKQSGSHQ